MTTFRVEKVNLADVVEDDELLLSDGAGSEELEWQKVIEVSTDSKGLRTVELWGPESEENTVWDFYPETENPQVYKFVA